MRLTPPSTERTQSEVELYDNSATFRHDEETVTDDRDCQRPSEAVQSRFMNLLSAAAVPVSTLHHHRRCGR